MGATPEPTPGAVVTSEPTDAVVTTEPTSAQTPATCDEETWPDLDGGLVCGDCKVLVNNFDSVYGTCNGYCGAMGMGCKGAWEEVGDTCEVLYHITWADNSGKLVHPDWYPDFSTVTGVSLSDSTKEDMSVYFACRDTGHAECVDIELPCGRSCGM